MSKTVHVTVEKGDEAVIPFFLYKIYLPPLSLPPDMTSPKKANHDTIIPSPISLSIKVSINNV